MGCLPHPLQSSLKWAMLSALPAPFAAARVSCLGCRSRQATSRGLCSISFSRRRTSSLVVALISMHWQARGTCRWGDSLAVCLTSLFREGTNHPC